MPVLQPTASCNAQDATQPASPDTLRYVHTNAFKDTSSNFETTFAPISLFGTREASLATLANGPALHEREDFETSGVEWPPPYH